LRSLPMKRIFIALPITTEPEIDWSSELREEKSIRWIKPKNLHITLVPPWYVADSRMEAQLDRAPESLPLVAQRLKSLEGKLTSFEMRFDRVRFGPDPRKPRLIWAEGETPQQLQELKTKIEKRLEREPEDRPFKLHVTLARFRPENFFRFPVKVLDKEIEWSEQVKAFVLMESHLSPKGAEYKVLEKIKLG